MSTLNHKVPQTQRTIDASDRALGRVATEVADALRGKDSPQFERHHISGVPVHVINCSKVRISSYRKLKDSTYVRYSGYPGGKKEETLEKLVARRGYTEAVKRAVYGMLPNNKLRSRLMNRLSLSE